MQVLETARFRKTVKKLHNNQKDDLDEAIRTILADPEVGEKKAGDLADIQIYKFKMAGQLTLLAYQYEYEHITLTLLAFGSHENFYRNLKR